jgi:O-acetyl-ADP-ribose deacetylase (regulator of RNase III)
LPARFIIHAVGPVWQGGNRGEAALLASAYRSSMNVASERGLASIAFPAISTGIYGYPLQPATDIAVATVRAAFAARSTLQRVIFACFSPEAVTTYRLAGVQGSAE